MGVQGWGGLVTRALTANDPLNDQWKGGGVLQTRQREIWPKKKKKIFNDAFVDVDLSRL